MASTADKPTLACPPVMEHVPVKKAHPGWSIYSNKPLRLSGADIAFVSGGHYDSTLDPDRTRPMNDRNLSTESVFDLSKHQRDRPFSLVCHYSVHAQLSRTIPDTVSVCTVVQHGRVDADESEFEAFCR